MVAWQFRELFTSLWISNNFMETPKTFLLSIGILRHPLVTHYPNVSDSIFDCWRFINWFTYQQLGFLSVSGVVGWLCITVLYGAVCPGGIHDVQHCGAWGQFLWAVTWRRCIQGIYTSVQINGHRHCSLCFVVLWNAPSQLSHCKSALWLLLLLLF